MDEIEALIDAAREYERAVQTDEIGNLTMQRWGALDKASKALEWRIGELKSENRRLTEALRRSRLGCF